MDIDLIKSQIDIVEFIERFIPLKKAGVNYQGHCPFHNEKSPSFMVSPQKQFYKCFGCDKSGDIFSFLQAYKKIDFKEALNEICQLYNIDNPQTKQQSKSAHLQEQLKALSQHYVKNLLSDDNIAIKLRVFLQERGFDNADIGQYSLGYCKGDEWKAYFSAQEAQIVGILSQNGRCLFANRLVITLYSNTYKHIGFVGRTHPYCNFAKSPKYINSKESFLYAKSQNFYNFHRAKRHILESKKALIVEGYLDALSANKLGIKNCIATGGTAFNKAFLAQIAKCECEMVFCFDNDSAGQKNILNALKVCLENGYSNIFKGTLKAQNTQGAEIKIKDLNDILAQNLMPIITKSDGVGYYLKQNINLLNTAQQKDIFLNDFKRLIQAQKNPFLKQELITKAQNALHFSLFDKSHSAPPQTKTLKELIFFNIINDECNAYIASEYIDDELQEYSQSFRAFLRGEMDKTAFELSQRSDIEKLDIFTFKRALWQLRIGHLQVAINHAQYKKDFKHAIALSHHKNALEQELLEITALS